MPNAAIALAHSADPCFPTWGGELEPVGCCDIAPQDMNRRHFGRAEAGRAVSPRVFRWERARLATASGHPAEPLRLTAPHATEYREALLCLSV